MADTSLSALALIVAAGFAGSFHCVGMCGGFACALGRDRSGACVATVARHLIYNSGRLASYTFLGALAGMAGAGLLATDGGTLAAAGQRLLAVLAGVLMMLMGLQLLGRLQRLHASAAGLIDRVLAGALRSLLHAPGRAAPLAFGVFNGLLPCPLVYAFVALAAASADPARGALVMAAFGLGTFPAMLASGGLAARLRYHWRLRGVRVAGLFILALGAVTVARGVLPLDGHALHAAPWPLAVSAPAAAVQAGGHAH
jgi:sulfite exporter TauE/SafE